MYTRKDIIIRKNADKSRRSIKNTYLRTLYTRPYDFRVLHDVIFDFKNEYITTNKTSHIFSDYRLCEKWLEDIQKIQKPLPTYQLTTSENQQAVCQNKRSKRQLVNVGLDECSTTSLYCNEEMPPMSTKPEDEVDEVEQELPMPAYALLDEEVPIFDVSNVEEDPYADSDDDRDKDYVPEDLDSSQSDDTIIVADESKVIVEIQQAKTKTRNIIQVEKLRDNHTDRIDKNIKKSATNTTHSEISLCEYVGCDVEVFSTCGKCLCFLCYAHFINDNSYDDCKNHNSSYLQASTNLKIKSNKKITKKNTLTKLDNQKTIRVQNIIMTKITQNTKLNKNNDKPTEKRIFKRSYSSEISKNCLKFEKQPVVVAPTFRKRRNTIDVCLPTCATENEILNQRSEPESSPMPKLRKKYNTPLLERNIDKKNKRILEHSVKTACGNKCLKKCTFQFSEEDRVAINTLYWKMTWQQQHSFVRAHTSVAIPKRKSTSDPKRKPKRAFVLKKSDDIKVDVCKHFFLTTLGYEKTNDRPLHNNFSEGSEDKRGKHQKTLPFDRNLLTQHVESFNPLALHYRREHAPLRRYLQNDISLRSMHLHFLETYPGKKVSYETYRQHVKKLNISFTQLGNEECELCEAYCLHKKETSHDAKLQIVEECAICVDYAKHRDKYTKSRALYNEHKLIESDSEKYFSVDLEKVIMLPRMETFKSVLFCQRLTVFNETFAPVGKITLHSKPLTVIWHDAIAGRKQNDILSAFYHFFCRHRDVANIHLWLDNCSSQNKNWLLYLLIVHLVNSDLISTEQVILSYFEPGHTFMSCDQVHHQVELAMKNRKKIYDFADFEYAVASINKSKVVVKSMGIQDFIDVPNYVSERRVQNSNPRAYLAKMVQVRFVRENYDLSYKNDFEDELIPLRFLNDKYLKNPSVMSLQHRSEPKGIDPNRKTDLLRTIKSIMPCHKQLFWKNLPLKKENENVAKAKKRLTY